MGNVKRRPVPKRVVRNLRTRALVVQFAFAGYLISLLVLLAYILAAFGVVSHIHPDVAALRRNLPVFLEVDLFAAAVGLLAVVAFLCWVHRASNNAWAVAGKLNTTPALTVGSYFIPGANLILPCVAMQEIWRATFHPADWKKGRLSILVFAWWACFALRVPLLFGALILSSSRDADSFRFQIKMFAAAEALSVIWIVLQLLLVRAVTSRQNEWPLGATSVRKDRRVGEPQG